MNASKKWKINKMDMPIMFARHRATRRCLTYGCGRAGHQQMARSVRGRHRLVLADIGHGGRILIFAGTTAIRARRLDFQHVVS